MKSSEPTLGRGAAIATVGTALSRATGFLRLAAAAYAIGATESKIADTYRIANSTPNIIFELVLGGVLSAVVLRLYIEVRDTEGQQEAFVFLTRLTKLTVLVLSAITVIGVLAAPLIIRAYTFRTPQELRAAQELVGGALLRLFVPQILFYGLSYISDAVLKAHQRLGVIMTAPVLNNLVVTMAFLMFAATVPEKLRRLDLMGTREILILGLGTTAGVVLLGSIPFLYMRVVGFRFVRGAGIRDPRLRRLARLSIYQILYVATNQTGLWVALVLANRIQGGVTGYVDSFVFFQLPHGLFAVSISVVVHTAMTERAVAGDWEEFCAWFSKGARAIAFTLLPAVAGYIALAPAIVRLLLEHGVFGRNSTALLGLVIRVWAPGIFFFSIFYLVLRAFYALGDTKTPMYINLGGFAVNVAVNLALFFSFSDPSWKVAALAIGHGASYLFASLLGLWLLRKRVGKAATHKVAQSVVRLLPAAAVTGVAAFYVAEALESASDSLFDQALQVTLATVAGLLIYVAASALLRSEELTWWRMMLGRGSMSEDRQQAG